MLGHAVCPCFPSFPMPVLPGPGALFGTGEYSDRLLHIMQVRSLLSGITTKRVPSGSVSSLISRSESTAARLMATSTSLAPQSAACWWRRRRFRPSAQPRLFAPPPPPPPAHPSSSYQATIGTSTTSPTHPAPYALACHASLSARVLVGVTVSSSSPHRSAPISLLVNETDHFLSFSNRR